MRLMFILKVISSQEPILIYRISLVLHAYTNCFHMNRMFNVIAIIPGLHLIQSPQSSVYPSIIFNIPSYLSAGAENNVSVSLLT